MGYYNEIGIALRKKDYNSFLKAIEHIEPEFVKNYYIDLSADENENFTENQKHKTCKISERCYDNKSKDTITIIHIPYVKFCYIEPFIEFMEKNQVPYKLVKIGEDRSDNEEYLYYYDDEDEEFAYEILDQCIEIERKVNICL